MDYPSPSSSKKIGTRITRGLVGGSLLTAAAMKLREGRLDLPHVALLSVEIPIGLWLISGWKWPVARWAAIFWMFILSVVSFQRAATGAVSCGCFGQIAVNPWLIFPLDIAALFALLLTPSTPSASASARRKISVAIAQAFLVTIAVAIAFQALRERRSGIALLPGKSASTQPWPLAQYIDAWPEVSHGNWVVLLYDSHCRACVSTREAYEDMAKTWQAQKKPAKICLIDTIADSINSPEEYDPASVALHALLKLPATTNIEIATPTLVLLSDGQVVEISEGYDDCVWNDRKFPR